MQSDDNNTSRDMLFNLGDDDDEDVLFSSTNPLIGGQAPLNDSLARPLTIQTEQGTASVGRGNVTHASATNSASGKVQYGHLVASNNHQQLTANGSCTLDEFSMIVSPSLLTPTDMEIWRAIKQGQLDPKKIPPVYGAGGHIPKSLANTPTAQLLSADLLGADCSGTTLLAELENELVGGEGFSDLGTGPNSRTSVFRTIDTTEKGGLLQQGMLI
uniref:Uncharacterized protein n=1 Tax=Anopheles christyi TaxID=43041 RepID=A0A182JT15_9DIPT